MDKGYVKLWRKSVNSAIFTNPDLWKLWCMCLLKANYKQRYVSIDGITEPVKLHPGEFATGRYSLHAEYYPKRNKKNKSPLTVWRWLEKLKNLEILNIKKYNKYSIITITNWEQYQYDEQQLNNRRTTAEQQLNTDKKVKKVKNKKENIKRKGIGTFQNVFLSEEELTKLKKKFNNGCDGKINALSEGIASKGYKYKSHYATILSWHRKNERETKQPDNMPPGIK